MKKMKIQQKIQKNEKICFFNSFDIFIKKQAILLAFVFFLFCRQRPRI